MEEKSFSIGACSLVELGGKFSIIIQGGKSLPITSPEGEIIKKLHEHVNNVVSKEELIVAGWGNPETIGSNSLPVAITNLRKVLELEDIKIINIPRKGYLMKVPESEEVVEKVVAVSELSQATSPLEERSKEDGSQRSIPLVFNRRVSNWSASLIISFCILGFFYISFSWVTPTCEVFDEVEVCYLLSERQKKDISEELNVLGKKKGTFYVAGEGDEKRVFHHE